MSQLVLGTAQFGDGYGITNKRGRMSDTEVAEILDLALDSGVTHIDTAAVYGDALQRLRPWSSAFTFTGKIVGTDSVDPVEQVSSSLNVLGCEKFDACLVREWDQLDGAQCDYVVDRMIHAQQVGLVDRIGVAAYTRDDVRTFREHLQRADHEIGALQVPANPIDRRLDDFMDLTEISKLGATVAIRSAFLQGILLSDSHQFSSHPAISRFHDYLVEQNTTALGACLSHVQGLEWASQIVVGVTTTAELLAIKRALDTSQPQVLPVDLGSLDLNLIDPRRW